MRRLGWWWVPTFLGGFALLVTLAVVLLPATTRGGGSGGRWWIAHGLVWTWWARGTEARDGLTLGIRWVPLIVQVVLVAVVVLPVGRWLTHLARPVRVWPWHLLAAVVPVFVAAAAGMIWSLSYWGFVFSPPGVDARVVGAREVRWVGHWVHQPGRTPPTVTAAGTDLDGWGGTSGDNHRIEVLADKPRAGEAVDSASAEAFRDVLTTQPKFDWGRVAPGSPREVQGMAAALVGPDGRDLLWLTSPRNATGGDHYASYELLLGPPTVPGDDRTRPVLSMNRWYYDIAGIEGVTWWVVAAGLLPVGWLVTVPVSVAGTVAAGIVRRRRSAARGFAVG